MTPLQQQQKEAQEELEAIMLAWSNDLKGDESCMPTIRTFVDSLVARTREQTLLEVEAGMPKEDIGSYRSLQSTDQQTGHNEYRSMLLGYLRTLREGITGNEHAK